jgi:hypothetical protein
MVYLQFLFINDPDIATINAKNNLNTAFKTNLNEGFYI